MQRFRPRYYEKFVCTADQCPRTCCQEWKIPVDEATEERWRKLAPPQAVKPQRKALSAYIIEKEETRVIGLKKDHRWPFLTEKKLCALVSAYGDEVLSETCTDFPREVHVFSDHEEETLMPCCPAVIDLWKESESIVFPKVAQESGEDWFNLFRIREMLLQLFKEESVPVEELIKEAFYILLELDKQDEVTERVIDDYFSAKSVAKLRDAIAEIPVDVLDTMDECNELLQDLSVNYRKEGLYTKYLDPVIAQAEKLSETYEEESMREALEQFGKKFTAYEPLMRKFLQNEIYSDLLVPDGSLDGMIVALQWIAMEYAVIRHAVFLCYYRKENEVSQHIVSEGESEDVSTIPYEIVRDYLVVITRMTGYEEEDIYEYLENSFESVQWEWGYFALIVGR